MTRKKQTIEDIEKELANLTPGETKQFRSDAEKGNSEPQPFYRSKYYDPAYITHEGLDGKYPPTPDELELHSIHTDEAERRESILRVRAMLAFFETGISTKK